MTHVLNVYVDPTTGRLECHVASNLPPELAEQVFAAAAVAYVRDNMPGHAPRDILDRAVRMLEGRLDAVIERSPIVLAKD